MSQAKYVVIFRSQLRESVVGYEDWARDMTERVTQVPGFCGSHSFRDETGDGITLSYWASRDAINRWAKDEQHRLAQTFGRDQAYATWSLEICAIESARAGQP